jgi:hypothetical protein
MYNSFMLETENQQIEITEDDIKSWKVFIGLPCYDRQLTEPFVMSLMKLVMYFKQIGLGFSISTISDSLISRARNSVVAKFMASEEHTHLLFIDVDLGFEPESVLKLLWHDKDIITGAYPIKDIQWDKVAKYAKEGVEPDKLLRKATRFVANPVKIGQNTVKTDNGAIAVHDAGTGFMLIKREALVKMFNAYPELRYKDDTGSLKGEELNHTYALFNSYVDEDQRFLSEDYGFVRYWQKLDGDIWVDPSIEMSHLGRLQFQGNMIEYLVQLSKEAEEAKANS